MCESVHVKLKRNSSSSVCFLETREEINNNTTKCVIQIFFFMLDTEGPFSSHSFRRLSPGSAGRVERMEHLPTWRRHLRLQVGKADEDPWSSVGETIWRECGTALPVPQRDAEVQDEKEVPHRWGGREVTGWVCATRAHKLKFTDQCEVHHKQVAAENACL